MFFDDDGLIVHRGLDGGDTAQREGWYWLGVWIRENLLNDPWPLARRLTITEVIGLLEPKGDGVFYRHPKLPPWNNPHDKKFGFSRDQMVPLVAAMGAWGHRDAIRRLWNALPQDPVGGTKHTFNGEWVTVLGEKLIHTGDVVAFSTINLFRRSWGEDPANSGNGSGSLAEAELLANSALKIPPAMTDRDNVGDDLNHIVSLLMSIICFPNSTTESAVNSYAKNRLVSYGSFVGAYQEEYGENILEIEFNNDVKRRLDEGIAKGWRTDASRVYGAVRWYHRPSTGANRELAEIYEPIIKAYLE